MKALLIYPQFPDTFWSFKHALQFIGKKTVSPPLGLLTIAAMLPEDWELRLIDMNTGELSPADLAWADLAMISAMTAQRKSTHKTIQKCKAAGLKIVAGGPLFSGEQAEFPDVDTFVLNEGELTLPPYLADLGAGSPQPAYSTQEFADLSTTPIPRWDLVDFDSYATMNVQFSRGCPYNCDFCNVTALLGHRPRTKSAAQMMAELDSLYQSGWRGSIFFVDDNFIGNKNILKRELLPALIAWREGKTGITFSTEASINLADDDTLMLMLAQAGFNSVFIGIETPDEASLAGCQKKQNLKRDLIGDVRRIIRSGLQVQGGFIVGFDTDLPNIFQRQIDFIQTSGIVTAMVGLLQAPPGTRLYERMQREDRLLYQTSGNNVDGTTNIVPLMGLEALNRGYLSILEYIYAPKHYYRRVRTFLQEYQPPKIKLRLSGSEVITNLQAFIRSIYLLGIRGKERAYYWGLLLWTLLHRPRLFPQAVTLSIYGYHFRKVCENVLALRFLTP